MDREFLISPKLLSPRQGYSATEYDAFRGKRPRFSVAGVDPQIRWEADHLNLSPRRMQ
jgi:hypothetical protein